VKVKVLFFASLREALGPAGEEIELPADVATVAALRVHLARRGGAWEGALAEKKNVRAAVNQDMVKPGAAIRGGDEIAFFPPVTGG
jgi:molybdopterin synthase sulfur carrier subunit